VAKRAPSGPATVPGDVRWVGGALMEDVIDAILLAVSAVGVLLAGISKGGFGGAASFVGAPVMALVMEPGTALAVMLPLLMVMDATALRAYWGAWSGRDTRLLVGGGLVGLILAALVYRQADADIFRVLIGVIALGFVLARTASLLRRPPQHSRARPLPIWAGIASGVGAGFTSFVAHAGGPILLVWLLAQNIGKRSFQATTVAVFAILNVVKLGLYGGLGLFTAETLRLSAVLAPVALLGAGLGIAAHARVPARAFFVLTYGLLLVAGLKLIRDGLT